MNDLNIKSRWELPIPVPKAMMAEAVIDELTRDAMFHDWEWMRAETNENVRDMLCEVIAIIWRNTGIKSDEERVSEIRTYILGFIESWAENEANHED